ncbi:MAG: N-6 DNA methylase [Kiritimatiellia bacterium]|jgi:type I restriction enzyme M protein
MITRDNFQNVLESLGFNRDLSGIWVKKFHEGSLSVDFASERLVYPDDIRINAETTTNFNAAENFVVFECVHRLLQKGYRPRHIELERPLKVGHGSSGGRLDIWIKDNNENSLLIIECKTSGKEFDAAWADMHEDGGQLFSYANALDSRTPFVALYTANWDGVSVTPQYHLVSLKDNEEFLKTLPKDAPSFRKATTVKARYQAWAETYRHDSANKGLFEEDIAAYTIGKTRYSVKDLNSVDADQIQRKYHEFATILRQHNVASHENAFDKLVNLFLAKIVDEKENPEALKFFWKGSAYDDVFSLIDRLQYLYKLGMEKFLRETVTYIDNNDIEKAFRLFKKDATKRTILDYFRQLKFFTNNDFAFIDVHNERLFHQNAAVLLRIVRMLQDIRLQTQEDNQFLGDLFEGFLDKGVKQSEGQFFTPMPIVRFLVSSLPLKKIVKTSPNPPTVVDYACGAGHFLSEYCNQILPFVREKEGAKTPEGQPLFFSRDSLAPYYAAVTGVEKEYRLSKVSKVSAFMYGHDDIRIVHADALAGHKEIEEGTFSVLVSNPPYSVKGFLETLSEADRARYELFDSAGDLSTNNSIECFFVERAKQLLAPDGVAAIILPSSILSKGGIYERMREILIKYFDIVAIVELGSGTFGKTGTNTATLFLRRKDDKPDLAEHCHNRAEAWFQNDFSNDDVFEDSHLLADYCDKTSIPLEDYKTLLAGEPSASLLKQGAFQDYRKAFDSSAAAKAIARKRATGKYTEATRTAEMEAAWLKFLREIEIEKLAFFMLAAANPQPVVLVKSPSDNKAMKEFLGYEWSSRKGNEGIKYIGTAARPEDDEDDAISRNKGVAHIQTPLYSPGNLSNPRKINSIIRAAFNGETPSIPESLAEFVSRAELKDLLDFSRVSFDKAFITTRKSKLKVKSKYPMPKLGEVAEIIRGVTYSKQEQVANKTSNVILTADNVTLDGRLVIEKEIYLRESKVLEATKRLKKNDCFMCFSSGSKAHIGKVAFIEQDLPYYAGGFMGIVRTTSGDVLGKFLYEILNSAIIRESVKEMSKGANINNLSSSLLELKTPCPPPDIQHAVIAECEAIDAEYIFTRMSIEEYQTRISNIFLNLEIMDTGGWQLLCQLLIPMQGNQPKIQEKKILQTGKTPVITQERNTFISGYTNLDACITDLPVVVFGDHSCSIKYVDFPFVRGADGTQLLKTDENVIRMKFLAEYLKTVSIENAERYERHFKYLKNLRIPVPSLHEQDRIIAEVEQHEAKIAAANAVLASAPARKQAVLEKFLN